MLRPKIENAGGVFTKDSKFLSKSLLKLLKHTRHAPLQSRRILFQLSPGFFLVHLLVVVTHGLTFCWLIDLLVNGIV